MHVWWARVDLPTSDVFRLSTLLAIEERERSQRFRFVELRNRYTVAHAMRRLILAAYLGVDPDCLGFAAGPWGKPELAADTATWLHFNESEARGVALLALTREQPVGVDLEELRPIADALRVVRMCGSALEVEMFSQVSPEEQDLAFLRWWTAKEACVKAVGTGLYENLASFSVSFDSPPSLLDAGGIGPRSWSLLELNPVPGFIGAVVVEGPVQTLRLREWSGLLE